MMRISLSIELIWKIAGEEAIGGDFEKIEPEHFMMALLKFAELTEDATEKYIANQEVTKNLLNEIRSLRELLGKNNIDSTRLRREMRHRMGKGSCPYRGEVMHRSDASREMFDQVALFAQDEGHDTLVAVVFLEYMLSYPTPLLKEVLEDLTEALPKQHGTPLIDQYGTNLMDSLDYTGKTGYSTDAQNTGFLNVIRFSRKKVVFLIAPTFDEADTLTKNSVIKIKSDKNRMPDFRSTLFFSLKKLCAEDFNESVFLSKIDGIIQEANGLQNVILILPLFELPVANPGSLATTLESSLKTGTVKVVCPVSELSYENKVQPGTVLNAISEPVWVIQNSGNEIPWEL